MWNGMAWHGTAWNSTGAGGREDREGRARYGHVAQSIDSRSLGPIAVVVIVSVVVGYCF